MSIKTGIAALALATLAVTGSIASTTQAEAKGLGWGIGAGLLGAAVVGSSTQQADAKPFGLGWGVGAGIVGAAIVGSAIAASNDGYYYDGYRRCGWVRQFDAYGNYMGRVRTCNY